MDHTYATLIDLLTCGALAPEDRDAIERQILEAPSTDPIAEGWTGLEADRCAMACMLVDLLDDYAATSDKIDEAHEQIQDMFDGDFPDFPYKLLEKGRDLGAYFGWLNTELAQWAADEGGYEALLFETGADDRMSILPVYRRDAERIVELVTALGQVAYRPASRFMGN